MRHRITLMLMPADYFDCAGFVKEFAQEQQDYSDKRVYIFKKQRIAAICSFRHEIAGEGWG